MFIMIRLYASVILLSFLAFLFATAATPKDSKFPTSKTGKSPHPELSRAVLDITSKQAFKAYQDNMRAGIDHYKKARKLDDGNPRIAVTSPWQSYAAWQRFEQDRQGPLIPMAEEHEYQMHMKDGSDALHKADHHAKTNWIIGSTIKGTKLAGKGSKNARDALELVAKNALKRAEGHEMVANYHMEKFKEVYGTKRDGRLEKAWKDLSRDEKRAEGLHLNANNRAWWIAQSAAATTLQISSVIKNVPHNRRINHENV